jgi:hypothetical protein
MSPDNTSIQKLNFSQRNGLEELNKTLQINFMDKDLKTVLYNFCYENCSQEGDIFYFKICRKILYSDFFKIPLTNIFYYCSNEKKQFAPSCHWDDERKRFRNWFATCKWSKIYDFFEFCFSKIDSSDNRKIFTDELNLCLEKEKSGYRMVKGYISKIIDEHEIESIEESFTNAPPEKNILVKQ